MFFTRTYYLELWICSRTGREQSHSIELSFISLQLMNKLALITEDEDL